MRLLEKTKYKGIYFDKNTQKYVIKFNYKVYNPVTASNVYKQKWISDLPNITAAKLKQAELKASSAGINETDITLEGAYTLWIKKMKLENRSPVTLDNNEQYMDMLYKFISPKIKMKDFTVDMYYDLCQTLREYGYSEETLHSLNATIRKLINLIYKKHLIPKNILDEADNLRLIKKDPLDVRIIPPEHYHAIDKYLETHSFVRLGVDRYVMHRLAFAILWGCGIRIGELLALTWKDIAEFRCDEHMNADPNGVNVYAYVNITKAYVSDIKLTKSPKNIKKRSIILPTHPYELFKKAKKYNLETGGSENDKMFPWTHGASDNVLKKVCRELNLPPYHCHEFRHAYCSYLISSNVPLPIVSKMSGDTIETLINRYIHPVLHDEILVLKAIDKIT